MNGKGFGLVAVLIAIIAAGVFFFVGDLASVPVQDVTRDTDATTTDPTMIPVGGDVDTSENVRVEHVYSRGMHTLTGEINVPTPCHILSNSVLVAESFPEQVTVQFVTTTDSEMCAQVITPEPFKVSFEASEKATIRLTLNGEKLEYVVEDEMFDDTALKDVSADDASSTTEESIEEDEQENEEELVDSEIEDVEAIVE